MQKTQKTHTAWKRDQQTTWNRKGGRATNRQKEGGGRNQPHTSLEPQEKKAKHMF